MDFTARLALQKPNSDPVTGDDVDIDILNANFDAIDAAISSTPCTSSTRPASPFQGQIILETDTGKAFIRLGASWVQIPTVNAAGTHIILSGVELNLTRSAANGTILYGQVTGDTFGRFLMNADGRMEFGPGNAARDTVLYRGGQSLLRTDDNFVAAGVLAGQSWESIRTTTSPTVQGTTEVVIQTLTFPAISGTPYMVTAMQNIQSSALNDLVRMRLKWQAGSTFTAAGSTKLLTTLPSTGGVANRGMAVTLNKVFTPNVSGNVTVGITFQREAGTADVISFGQVDRSENSIIVAGA